MPSLKSNVNILVRELVMGIPHTVSLPYIMIRILGMGMPARQLQIHWTRQDGIPARSQQLALDPEGSSVTKNTRPPLRAAINRDHDAYNRVKKRTRWEHRLRLILIGQE